MYGNAPRTQAEWDAKRAEVKTEAAVTVEAARKAAVKNLKTFNKSLVPATTEAPKSTESVYGDFTKDELVEALKERELPHSGTKDELVARLEESDQAGE